jgi:transposase InsO family protein
MSHDSHQQVVDDGMVQSVGRTGVCGDNSVTESAWSSLKRELVHRYGSTPEPRPARRSSLGSTATTHAAGTPPSATPHPPPGSSKIIDPRPTRPRNRRDLRTGQAQISFLDGERCRAGLLSWVDGIDAHTSLASDPEHGRTL